MRIPRIAPSALVILVGLFYVLLLGLGLATWNFFTHESGGNFLLMPLGVAGIEPPVWAFRNAAIFAKTILPVAFLAVSALGLFWGIRHAVRKEETSAIMAFSVAFLPCLLMVWFFNGFIIVYGILTSGGEGLKF